VGPVSAPSLTPARAAAGAEKWLNFCVIDADKQVEGFAPSSPKREHYMKLFGALPRPRKRSAAPASWITSRGGSRGEGGAALVEFAVVMPLLVLLLCGIIDFGWLFAQNLDVRHGAREGARLAAVNFPEGPSPNSGARSDANRDELVAEVCARMQTPTDADITISSTGAVGDSATVTVTTLGHTLTGFLDFLLPPTLNLNSTVQIRLEQAATWTNTTGVQMCP